MMTMSSPAVFSATLCSSHRFCDVTGEREIVAMKAKKSTYFSLYLLEFPLSLSFFSLFAFEFGNSIVELLDE